MNKNNIIKLTIFLAIVVGIIFLLPGLLKKDDPVETEVAYQSVEPVTEIQEEVQLSESNEQNDIKIFEVDGVDYEFSIKEIKVNVGDAVKIVFTSKEGFHNWVVDEFNATTRDLRAGETDTIEFKADEAGVFEYYCSIGSHRALGMVGTLIVE